jgi:hypothetical protein
VYAALALDPIGARPWDIARLTDFQIERLYLNPARKRARDAGAPGVGGPAAGTPADAPADAPADVSAGVKSQIAAGGVPSKPAMMNLLMTLGGMTAKDAAAEYDRQLAEHNRGK